MRLTGSDAHGHKTNNSLTTSRHTTSLWSARLEVIEWGRTWSEDDGGAGGCGARLGLRCGAALGFAHVEMVRGHVRVVRVSQDGSE